MTRSHFHRDTMTLIVNDEPIPAELLSKVRGGLPDDERYSLKFIVYPVAQGVCAELDVARLVDGLDQIAVVRNFGLSPAALKKALEDDWNGRESFVADVRPEPPKPIEKKKVARIRSKETAPRPSIEKVPVAPQDTYPPVEIGSRITVEDENGSKVGRILSSDKKVTRVMWDMGAKSIIKTRDLYLKQIYKIG